MNGFNNILMRKYGKLYTDVRDIINGDDPIQLLKDGIPEDEYHPEISVILSHVKVQRSLDEMHRFVYTIFVQKFDRHVAGPPERYRNIARQLFALTHPVGKGR